MKRINLNADLGESFGPWRMGEDAALLQVVASASIACGFHAGDPTVMRRTVRQALDAGASLGAHPGWPDLQGFGRRPMQMSTAEVEALVIYQLGALAALAGADQGLFEALRARRLELARAQNVPPYVIFHDRTLLELAAARPASGDEMAAIAGIGAAKLARYGADFLEVIRTHAD